PRSLTAGVGDCRWVRASARGAEPPLQFRFDGRTWRGRPRPPGRAGAARRSAAARAASAGSLAPVAMVTLSTPARLRLPVDAGSSQSRSRLEAAGPFQAAENFP